MICSPDRLPVHVSNTTGRSVLRPISRYDGTPFTNSVPILVSIWDGAISWLSSLYYPLLLRLDLAIRRPTEYDGYIPVLAVSLAFCRCQHNIAYDGTARVNNLAHFSSTHQIWPLLTIQFGVGFAVIFQSRGTVHHKRHDIMRCADRQF